MSHFAVMVIGEDIEKQLMPFHEFECTGIDEHIQDVDQTEDLKSEWESEKDDYESISDFLAEYHGIKCVESEEEIDLSNDHKYGYAVVKDGELLKAVKRTNPNAKWDWWRLGGRWTGYFKAKEGAEGMVGEPGLMTPPAKEGRYDQLRKSDVDIKGMQDEAEERELKRFDAVQKELSKLSKEEIEFFVPWEKVLTKEDKDIDDLRKYHSQPVVEAFNSAMKNNRDLFGFFTSINPFLTPRETFITNVRNGALSPYAVLKDGNWYQKGKMGWFGMSSDEITEEEWNQKFIELFESLDNDTLLSVVDCHI